MFKLTIGREEFLVPRAVAESFVGKSEIVELLAWRQNVAYCHNNKGTIIIIVERA